MPLKKLIFGFDHVRNAALAGILGAKRWLLPVLGAFSVLVVSYALRYGYGVVVPQMSSALSLTNDQIGVIVSAYFIAYALFTPIAGLLADKLGVKRVIASFIAVMGIGSLLMSLSSSFLHCLAFFFIVGLGSAASWAPMATLTRTCSK
ncbi:MAG: MFS transporter [Candidatus Nezhaarchaeales archaeon]